MNHFQIYTADECQSRFCQQIGLHRTQDRESQKEWNHPSIGFIRSYGSMDTIQTGIGKYTIDTDFQIEYCYDASYLHFGTIYEGVTYEKKDAWEHPLAIPSSFFILERAFGNVNQWKKGQKFRGVEVLIEYQYFREHLMPFLELTDSDLDFFIENHPYLDLSDDIKKTLEKIEHLLMENKMTFPLQLSLCLELVSYLLHPNNRSLFEQASLDQNTTIQIGKRSIHLSKQDFSKILQAKELLDLHATSFPTAFSLSRNLKISEQKLKAGFCHFYKTTIGDYANNVRMNEAVRLLRNTNLSIGEISQNIGYQNASSFNAKFKNWCGLTPLQFRKKI